MGTLSDRCFLFLITKKTKSFEYGTAYLCVRDTYFAIQPGLGWHPVLFGATSAQTSAQKALLFGAPYVVTVWGAPDEADRRNRFAFRRHIGGDTRGVWRLGLWGVLEQKMGGLLGMGMMHEGLRIKQPYDTEIGPWCELNLLREWAMEDQVSIRHISRCLSHIAFSLAVIWTKPVTWVSDVGSSQHTTQAQIFESYSFFVGSHGLN